MDLNTVWFVLIGVLIAGYAVLDGFDLGAGALSLLARSPEERELHVAAVAPVWDGNEVWLLTGGGALFAAFPAVYATVFSGFYLALMLVLLALIARAVSLEFRGQVASPAWKAFWDAAFGVGSLLPAILFGVAVGNVLHGVPVADGFAWQGSFLGLLNPYSLLVGLTTGAFFVMHGALYLRVKMEGALAERMGRVARRAWVVFLVLYALATLSTAFASPFLFGRLTQPLGIALTALVVLSVVGIPLFTRGGRARWAFTASSVLIVAMILVAAVNAYPILVVSSLGLDKSLTIYNAASSPRTLATMLVIALVGMPIVLVYTVLSYRVFRGKAHGRGYEAV
ncbi:MAG TPA: cytochrome d ubiquinol oxidase subunit II [Anaeromyxobacteraceae bacterium]|nr:cytochrome d ubiquinol oxidase subunit II [Anaeromyxobacteraceae bacterium]